MNTVNTFKDRLVDACNKSTLIPEYNHGQQVTLSKLMSVSQEAVRKWMAGETRPRPNAVKKLAEILDVEYIWLNMGSDQEQISSYREVSKKQDASLYAFVSFVFEAGGTVAFNRDSNDTSDVTVINDGVIRKYSVYPAVSKTEKGQEFKLTAQSNGVVSVCACKYEDADVCYDFIEVPEAIAAEHAKKGRLYTINRKEKEI